MKEEKRSRVKGRSQLEIHLQIVSSFIFVRFLVYLIIIILRSVQTKKTIN